MFNFAQFKRIFLFSLIGSLIISALVAVITVLIGDFNEITSRVLLTLLMVVVHSLVSLAFIYDDERRHTFERLSLFINVLFTLIVASFITSLFGIWKTFPSELVQDLYQTYFILGFAALHGNILSKALGKETYMNVLIYVNYLFMATVVLMLQPVIYMDNLLEVFGKPFYRILGAAGIIDGTLSILTIIFYKLYMNKHPQVENLMQSTVQDEHGQKRKGLSPWVWILIIYLVFQVAAPVLYLVFGSLF